MVKAISSIMNRPVIRNTVAATMLTMSALALGACAGGNSNKTAGQTQTEVVSREGADAVKNYNAVLNTHCKDINPKIEQGLSKITTDKKQAEESIKNFKRETQNSGAFIATAKAQNYINQGLFMKTAQRGLLSLGISKYDVTLDFDNQVDIELFASLMPELGQYFKFMNWVIGDFNKSLEGVLTSSEQSYEAVSATLDKFINDQNGLSNKEKGLYTNEVKEYKNNQLSDLKNTNQGNMDIVAFKTKKIAEIVYANKLAQFNKELSNNSKIISDENWQKYNDLCQKAKTF